jgi:hypothetical protein
MASDTLFANGPIEITWLGGNSGRVKMGTEAPPELCSCGSTRLTPLNN